MPQGETNMHVMNYGNGLEICEPLKRSEIRVGMEIACEISDVRRPHEPSQCYLPMKQRVSEKQKEHHSVVKRENAQRTPHIEIAETVRTISGVEQYASNEESRENEEEVNPSPSPGKARIMVEKHH